MLSGAIRTDGSSRFGKNNRWGYFPSASAAWRITEENFFKEQTALSFINDLKLRLSYGVTGNFQIGNYEHLATMSLDNYILGTGQGLLSYGYKPDNIEREDLSWEKIKWLMLVLTYRCLMDYWDLLLIIIIRIHLICC